MVSWHSFPLQWYFENDAQIECLCEFVICFSPIFLLLRKHTRKKNENQENKIPICFLIGPFRVYMYIGYNRSQANNFRVFLFLRKLIFPFFFAFPRIIWNILSNWFMDTHSVNDSNDIMVFYRSLYLSATAYPCGHKG